MGQGVVLIAVTGWGQEDDRRRSHEAGFDHHLVKPVDPHLLVALLAAYTTRGSRPRPPRRPTGLGTTTPNAIGAWAAVVRCLVLANARRNRPSQVAPGPRARSGVFGLPPGAAGQADERPDGGGRRGVDGLEDDGPAAAAGRAPSLGPDRRGVARPRIAGPWGLGLGHGSHLCDGQIAR